MISEHMEEDGRVAGIDLFMSEPSKSGLNQQSSTFSGGRNNNSTHLNSSMSTNFKSK
jgi:hypothetical protein